MKKISIIVPVYNVDKYLDKCIDSLINQTIEEIELIFINDGSTDDSFNILNKYKNNRKIIVINQENRGVSYARNKGIDIATGEYIGFVDPDDIVNNNMFEIMYNAAKCNNSDMIICDYFEIDETKNKRIIKKQDINGEDSFDILRQVLNNFITIQNNGYLWNKIFRADIIKKNNICFDKNITICEDVLFNLNFLRIANKINYVKKPLYSYYIRGNSAIAKKHEERFRMMSYLYDYTMICMNEWKLKDDSNINSLNTIYAPIFYQCAKETISINKGNLSIRIKNTKLLLNDKKIRYMKKQIFEKDLVVSLRSRIFYKISNVEWITIIYLLILERITWLKKCLKWVLSNI